jgi:hypothetical protein
VSRSNISRSAQLDDQQKAKAFVSLEAMSVFHSLVYVGLLCVWLFDGPAALRAGLGWAHGVMWIVMTVLVLIAARLAVVSFRLAVLVAVIGGLGPFAGTAGFIWEGRRKAQRKSESETVQDAAVKSR